MLNIIPLGEPTYVIPTQYDENHVNPKPPEAPLARQGDATFDYLFELLLDAYKYTMTGDKLAAEKASRTIIVALQTNSFLLETNRPTGVITKVDGNWRASKDIVSDPLAKLVDYEDQPLLASTDVKPAPVVDWNSEDSTPIWQLMGSAPLDGRPVWVRIKYGRESDYNYQWTHYVSNTAREPWFGISMSMAYEVEWLANLFPRELGNPTSTF